MEKELKTLTESEVPESDQGKGGLVMKIKQTLIHELRGLLFNNTSDNQGGEFVRHLFNQFHEHVFKVRKQ